MLIVISPAKTLDYETPVRTRKHTQPEFVDQTETLVRTMRKKKPAQLASLMHISPALAELNHARFQDFALDNKTGATRQAVHAFMGDVYTGLDARSLKARDIDYAQRHLRILSGLYGLLRPLDLMQAHRLEMGTALKTPRGGDLYRYWGELPTRALNEQARALGTEYLVNLASNEYFRAVDRRLLEATVITPVFKERKGDTYKVLSFFAKKARGQMARYMIQHRVRKPRQLLDFDLDGYAYNPALSSEREYVFTRDRA